MNVVGNNGEFNASVMNGMGNGITVEGGSPNNGIGNVVTEWSGMVSMRWNGNGR